MDTGLNIRSEAALDFVSLGALVHRLDPGVIPFHKATEFKIHVSGGEFNCAANLSDCFGMKTGIVTAMVDYPIGRLIAERVRAMGVRPFYKMFEHNGVNSPNMATVYSDCAFGIRAPEVFYNRASEAGALLKPGDFNWKEIFAGGVRWFHSGGIFASLSDKTPDLIIEGMRAAKDVGAVISFDMNYRAKLWAISGGEKRALEVHDRILKHVDVLTGGIPYFEETPGSEFDSKAFEKAVEKTLKQYPQLKVIATTLRKVQCANRHALGAVAWINGKTHLAPMIEMDVLDRVGSGDGFAAGLYYGFLAGETPEEAVKIGAAHGSLIMTFPGDTTMATLDQVRAVAKGNKASIQR